MRTKPFFAWLCLFFAAGLVARAEPTPADKTLSPYFVVKAGPPGQDNTGHRPDPLPLKSTQVEATIAGIFADVTVTQRYQNTGQTALEAIYVFPGSTRAAVHGLVLTVGDRRIQAKAKERSEARRTYEAAKAEGKTASLLEQQRPNVFQMNVANILPGDDVTVELRYTELLVPSEGRYEFVYPGVVGPRYSNKPEAGAAPEDAWVQNPYLPKDDADPTRYGIRVHLLADMPLQEVLCRSHPAAVTFSGEKEARVETQDSNGSNRDFIVSYRLAGGAVQTGLMVAEGGEENLFLLVTQPPARATLDQVPPREFIFIVDVSGSMNGFPLKVSKRLMGDLLKSLRPQDRFNLLLFAGGSDLYAPVSVPATPDEIRRAIDRIDREQGGGGTELLPALKRALALPRDEATSRSFIVITDGYVDIEAEAFDLVRSSLGQANLFAFGIGSSVNRHLLEGLARAGQGEPFVVTDPEHAPQEAARFLQYVSYPLLTHVKAEFDGLDVYDLEPPSQPDLLAERPIVLLGKWRGGLGGRVRIAAQSGQGPYHSVHEFSSATRLPGAEGLARVWARSRIGRLSDWDGAQLTDEKKAQVTSLGLTYNLLTRFTSFVAVDEEVRRATPELKTVKQPVPLPSGVENSAVGGGPVAAAPEPGTLGLMIVGIIVIALLACSRHRRVRRS